MFQKPADRHFRLVYDTRMKILKFIFFAGVLCCAAFPVKAQGVPKISPWQDGGYVAEGLCPFECCTYGHWKTDKDTPLYEKPDSAAQVIETIPAQSWFEARTGDVFVQRPLRLEVIRDKKAGGAGYAPVSPGGDDQVDFSVGDTLDILSHTGEGFYIALWKSKDNPAGLPVSIGTLDNPELYGAEGFRNCDPAQEECWWKLAPEQAFPENLEWWVRATYTYPPGGEISGWVRNDDYFENSDSCSGETIK